MPTKKKDPRGGKRPNQTGRPKVKKEYSDEFKAGILKAIAKKAEQTGKTVYDLFADKLYNRKTNDNTFAGLFKILQDTMVVKESLSESHEFKHGPTLYLPETKPKPKEFKEKEEQFKSTLTH